MQQKKKKEKIHYAKYVHSHRHKGHKKGFDRQLLRLILFLPVFVQKMRENECCHNFFFFFFLHSTAPLLFSLYCSYSPLDGHKKHIAVQSSKETCNWMKSTQQTESTKCACVYCSGSTKKRV